MEKMEELIETQRERTKTMPNPIEDTLNINITKIENMKATEILYQPPNTEDFFLEKLPEDTKNYDKSIKIILLGNSSVGKSSIVHCLNNETYDNYRRRTIGLEHSNYVIKINNVIIRMQIWDTAGQEKFDSITNNYYKNTDVAIFVYAINDVNSFNKIEQWDIQLNDKSDINNNTNDNNNENNIIIKQEEINKSMIKVLLGNKKDLEKDRQVTFEQGQKLSKDKKFEIFKEISCNFENEDSKNNIQNIKNLFDTIGKKVYKDFIKNDQGRLNSSSYCYQATNSILNGEGSVANKKNGNHSGSCCC